MADIDGDGQIIVGLVNNSPQGVTLCRRTYLAKATCVSGKRVNSLTVREWLEDAISCNRALVTNQGEEIHGDRFGRPQKRANDILQRIDRSTMTASQQRILEELVFQNPGCFALDGEKLSITPLTQFRLNTGDARPIRKRAYRIPECHKNVLRQMINKQLEEGIITPSRSEWSAPIILILKKGTEKFRLVVDHRGLNKALRKDSYPLPRIHDLLDDLKGAKVYTTLDMKDSYHQISIHPQDRHKTAFICREGYSSIYACPWV